MFVVSRVVKHLGVPVGVLILPILSMTAWHAASSRSCTPLARSRTRPPLINTVRNMLFCRARASRASAAGDRLVLRADGDVVSAVLLVCTTFFSLHPRGFAVINVARHRGSVAAHGQEYKALSARSSSRP
jgi:hypothetical protein